MLCVGCRVETVVGCVWCSTKITVVRRADRRSNQVAISTFASAMTACTSYPMG